MTERPPRPQTKRLPRVRAAVLAAVLSVVAMTVLASGVMAQGTTVVTAIPGGGWIQSPDNTPGGSTQLVAGPSPGTLGAGSLQLTTAASSDFAGVAHPFLPAGIPYADLTAGSWRTFVTGSTGNPDAEAASLRLSGYQSGFSVFTTLTVELVYNGGVNANVWQETALSDTTMVWQTTDNGDGFCLQTGPLCTFAAFKAQYPTGRFTAVQVAIGSGLPPVTSFADGVSVTTIEDGTEVTDTWDFEVAAPPTPTPTPSNPAPAGPTPTSAGLPNTSTDAPSAPSDAPLGILLGSLALLSAVSIATVRRRRLSR